MPAIGKFATQALRSSRTIPGHEADWRLVCSALCRVACVGVFAGIPAPASADNE